MKGRKRKWIDLSLFKTPGFWISLILSLLVVLLYLLSRPEINLIRTPAILELIEAKTLDLRFHLRGEIEPKDHVVIIAIDEETEDRLGRWQSSGRQWLANMLDVLQQGGAKVVGFDLTLAEADEGASLALFQKLRSTYFAEPSELSSKDTKVLQYLKNAENTLDYDRQLEEALQRAGNVVLGIYHFWDQATVTHLKPEKQAEHHRLLQRVAYTGILGSRGSTDRSLTLYHSFGFEANLARFSEAAKSIGHFNVAPDRDGFIRVTPLLVEYQSEFYPSLALEVAREYLNPSSSPLVYTVGEDGVGGIDAIQLGETFIPCDEVGRLLIHYYGPSHSFIHYSLADVILGDIPPHRFENKVVLVGFTSNIYQDFHSTAFQKDSYPGVEINATIVENIIRENFLIRPKSTTLTEALIIVGLGILFGIARHRRGPIRVTCVALLGLLLVALFAYISFVFGKIWMNVTFPFLYIVIDYLTITSYKYFTEEKQKRDVKHTFQHYVAPTVVEHMLKTVDTLKLGGDRRQLTAFFSDIRGFTGMSEQMPPEELVKFLNEYLSEMTQIILKYEGTVDKYMGGGIMAFYGAPLEQEDHVLRACKTAVDMLLRLKELRIGWEARGLSRIEIGIGINSGDMSVGNMGSRERFDYTIMGDNVNLASRLEETNKHYGTNIVISEFTYAMCLKCHGDGLTVRELDTVRVRGRLEPVTIYELIGYGELYTQKQKLIHKFSEALEAYKQKQWAQAITLFQAALKIDSDDKPSQVYIKRCSEYLKNPPADDLEGVFVMPPK